MGRPSTTHTLIVWMNGEHVGAWSMSARTEPSFTYAESWFASPAFRTLSLSLPAIRSNPSVRGKVVDDFFDNLLPDSDIIRKRLQSKFKASDTGAFGLLAAVGRDRVAAERPQDFPANLASAIFDGLRASAGRLVGP